MKATLLRFSVSTLSLLLLAANPIAIRAACDEQQRATIEPTTSTLAGVGRPGIADGTASTAEFVEPDGVASDGKGGIYVADRGGQNIRLIKGGRVTTIAGASTGTELRQIRVGGYIDGRAFNARFNAPHGVAVGPTGDVFVADFGNHAIRKIHNGVVSTVIGPQSADSQKNLAPEPGDWTITSTTAPEGNLHAAKGGGPSASDALVATASSDAVATSPPIAVQPGAQYAFSAFLDSRGNTNSGNVAFYITDATSSETLQAYATTEGTNGRIAFSSWNAPRNVTSVRINYHINNTGITGPVVFAQPVLTKVAYVVNPSALAIDSVGNLYVSDVGNGLRKLSAAGELTSVSDHGFVCGVSVRGSGQNTVLGFTDEHGIHIFVGGVERRTLTPDSNQVEPQDTGNSIGYACGIAVLDQYTVVLTDPRTNAVRIVRLPIEAPVASGAMVRTLVGGKREGQTALGGMRDGPTDVALADAPRGIAILGGSSVVFADSGNRRLRIITHVDSRGPQTPGFAGLESPPNRYRVAIVGASQTFHNTLWQQSIPGRIEAGLASLGPTGPKECPYVIDLRFSGLDVDKAIPLMSNYLGDGETDLVVYLVDIGHGVELAREPNWKADVPGQLRTLASQLKSHHTKMLLVSFPDEKAVSNLEGVSIHDLNTSPQTFDLIGKFHAALAEEDALVASGIPTLRLVRAFERAEESPEKLVLFESGMNYHASIVGQMYVGDAIINELRALRPWARP